MQVSVTKPLSSLSPNEEPQHVQLPEQLEEQIGKVEEMPKSGKLN